MFNKKYKPSVKANNELKEEVVKELKAIIYKLEKGKFEDGLDRETVVSIIKDIKSATEGLEYSIGTGDENVFAIAEDAKKQIKAFKKNTARESTNYLKNAAEDLVFILNLWKDVINGDAVLETEEDVKKAKVSRSRKKLNARLEELVEIKESFAENAKRLEKDIILEEKEVAELDSKIIKEDNERKLNELYRSVKATKSKIDMLSVRRNNYSACYNLLDRIYANAREILKATDFAVGEEAKAKVLLNIGKLKLVLNEPDKAIAIIKRMDKDVKDIAAKTKTIDEKVFDFDQGTATVNEDALKYKEELMRKKREKEGLSENIEESVSQGQKEENKTLKEEN